MWRTFNFLQGKHQGFPRVLEEVEQSLGPLMEYEIKTFLRKGSQITFSVLGFHCCDKSP